VPPIFIAILLVTVLVVELDTAVLANTVPVIVGSVSVGDPAVAGADSVTLPLVSPAITIDAIFVPIRKKCL
jgi:hypothetical protein